MSYCDRCGDDFRLDDTGGYNPPCACGLNCRSCCEHGRCERDGGPHDADEDDWQDYELRPGVDYGDTLADPTSQRAPTEGTR